MTTAERKNLVAPCGIDCGTCELYLSRSNEQLKTYLVSSGIPADKIPCDGCRAIQGNCPVIKEQCATYLCAQEHEVTYCHECEDFPCGKLAPAADRAEILPHNLKVFNLCIIRQRGVEGLIRDSMEIKKNYYKGKMKVGRGPQLAE